MNCSRTSLSLRFAKVATIVLARARSSSLNVVLETDSERAEESNADELVAGVS